MVPPSDAPAVEWCVFNGLTPYNDAVDAMDQRAEAIASGKAAEAVFLMEHPPLYTAGTSAGSSAPRDPRFPLYRSGRGGQVTYHGPGQRICYVMLDLHRRTPDLRAYVAALETWIIATLADFDVHGERREDRVGVWVPRPTKPPGSGGEMAEDKIAAIGIRVRRWISFHGLALNVAPDLTHYRSIVPCGIDAPHLGVTSLQDLGRSVEMDDVDRVLRRAFETLFGMTQSGDERQS